MTESETFLQSALDALSAHIAVLDADGVVLAVNAAWRRFAAANGDSSPSFGVGESYLLACERSGRYAAAADEHAAAEGIRAVAAGTLERFVMDHPGARPDGRSWFQMTVTRFAAAGPTRLVVAHENVTERKRVEDELRRSDERYRAFIEQSYEAIWRFELAVPLPVTHPVDEQVAHIFEHSFLAECNDATARMYGYERAADLVGLRLSEFMPREIEGNVAYLRRFVTAAYRLYGGESQEVDRAGSERHFLNNLIGVVEDGSLRRAWGTQRDVTELKRTEAALRQSEQKLRLALDAGGLATWEWHLDGTRVVSDNYADVVGAAPLSNETFLDLVHEADRSGVIAALQTALRETGVYRHEYRVVLRDGSVRWIAGYGRVIPAERGTPVHMIGVVMNVTARRESEEQREDERRSMQLALAVARAGVWNWDFAANRVTGDEILAQLFGLPVADVVAGRLSVGPFLRAVHVEDRRRIRHELRSIVDAGGEYQTEYRIGDRAGARWVASRGKIQFAPDGSVQRVAGIVFDVTAEKEHERDAALLSALGESIRLARQSEELLATVERMVRERLAVQHSVVAVADDLGKWTVHVDGVRGGDPLESVEQLPFIAGAALLRDLGAGRTVVRRARARGRDLKSREADASAAGVAAWVAVPRLRDGQLAFVAVAASDEPRDWSGREVRLIETVVERAWTANEKLRLDARLRASERRYRSLVSATAAIVAVADSSGWIVSPQPAWQAYTGQSWEQYREYGFIEAVHPDDRIAAAAAWQKARLAQSPFAYEARLRHAASGSHRYCLARVIPVLGDEGTVREWVASVIDVDEQRRADMQLRASEAEWRLVFESARDFAIFTLDLERRITRWNPGASRLLGYSDEEILGRNGDILFTPEDRTASVPEREAELALCVGRAEDERWHVRKDGNRFWASGLMMPLRNERDEKIGLVKILRDMTAAKRAAEERDELLRITEEARAEAEQANAAKDSFLATLSHELRSPLQAAMGWVSLLRSGRLSEVQRDKAVETLDRSIHHQVELVNDLLDMSRILTNKLHLELAPVDLTLAVEQACDECQWAARGKGVELMITGAAECGTVLGDAQRLSQVLRNLLTNAIKFTPGGGLVTVRCTQRNGWVVLSVTDTGQGIPRAFLPQIFDRFSQADPSITRRHGGLGLGLAIVRHLVDLHSGRVEADSDGEGQGATFRVWLPLASASVWHPPGAALRDVPLGPADLAGLRVLLVDDDVAAAQALGALLEQAGADVVLTSSARQGYEAATRHSPDVIVTDLAMPDEDGFWLARSVREAGIASPIIAVTGLADAETQARALREGFQAHLPKPTDMPMLVKTIRRAVAAHAASPDASGEA